MSDNVLASVMCSIYYETGVRGPYFANTPIATRCTWVRITYRRADETHVMVDTFGCQRVAPKQGRGVCASFNVAGNHRLEKLRAEAWNKVKGKDEHWGSFVPEHRRASERQPAALRHTFILEELNKICSKPLLVFGDGVKSTNDRLLEIGGREGVQKKLTQRAEEWEVAQRA